MGGTALSERRLTAGLIVDGIHVDPVAVRAAFAAKGADRIALVTDAMPTVGTSMDRFELLGRTVKLTDGRLTIEDGTLAGAHLDMMCGAIYTTSLLGHGVREHQVVTLEEAVRLITDVPARLYGLKERGRVVEGWHADLVMFDPATIDRELGWAEDLGFNSVRVFLHHLLWEHDREGFLRRAERFLEIADRHKVGVMFVLFDSVWDPFPRPGTQRAPRPHVHNSGWVQSPGLEVLKDPSRHGELEGYVGGVVGRFREARAA